MFKNLTHLTLGILEKSDLNIFDDLESLESCIIYRCPALGTNSKEGIEDVMTRMSRGWKNLKKLYWMGLVYLVEQQGVSTSSYDTGMIYLHCTFRYWDEAIFPCVQDMANLTHLLGIASRQRLFPSNGTDTLL